MPAEQVDGFVDNWAYLRTELHWLDRLLVTAVAKQRKETKDIDRIAQSKADRASSHWWKGVIVPDGKVSYDEYRQPAQATTPKLSYQNQVDAQIQATRKRGIVLALPALCERLKLNSFEKNVVLMSLAPEVNRRYARLYRYLQGEDGSTQTDLPTLDLVLRLLCKNDSEWRSSRNHLINDSQLTQSKLLDFLPTEDTLLNCSLKLTKPLVNYLLSDRPTAQALEALLPAPTVTQTSEEISAPLLQPTPLPQNSLYLRHSTVAVDWSKLILSATTLEALQSLALRLQGSRQAAKLWNLNPDQLPQTGYMALLAGTAGTGKTIAASALATALHAPLVQVDLAIVESGAYVKLIEEMAATAPIVLFIQSAQIWLKRSTQLPLVSLQQFWQQRCSIPTVTLFSVTQQASVSIRWQRQMDQILQFPMPTLPERICLWQQAFPAEILLDTKIDWQALAELPMNGGEIQSIVHETISYAAMETAPQVDHAHILKALSRRGKKLSIRPTSLRTKKLGSAT
jgi:hypothetical protein